MGGDPYNLLTIDGKGQGVSVAMSAHQQLLALPLMSFFSASNSGPGYSSGVNWNSLAVVGGRCYWISNGGVMGIDHQNRLTDYWRPDLFYYWNGLGGWVCGNCPVPPCRIQEIVADDKAPDLLWLVSHVPGIDKPMERYANYVTACRPGTGQFSRPLRISDGSVQLQPRGDYLYVTGALSAAPKKNWVLDQKCAKDQPPVIECPDTDLGRASRALLLGNKDEARGHLQAALDAGIATGEVKGMLRAVSALPGPTTKPATP